LCAICAFLAKLERRAEFC